MGVASGSPAERAGEAGGLSLLGAVIQRVGRHSVATRLEYEQAVTASSTSGVALVLLYTAGGQVHQTLISIPQ